MLSEQEIRRIGKLGFGLMRLPKLEDGSMDIEQIKQMVDLFLDKGFIYFDTAYVYDGGLSEEAARDALVRRYPRERFLLATKLNARVAENREAAEKQLQTSLERTEAGYFDSYLLHAIGSGNLPKYDEYRIWDFAARKKAEGLIKHWGFSFHDGPDLLDRLLNEHPDAEFVQLQINYADWEDSRVASRRCYEVAQAHGKPVVVMEPVKGGTLANPPQRVRDVLAATEPDASPASWAIRFAASQQGVMTVLSGMSNLDQMRDNLKTMAGFTGFTAAQAETLEQARKALLSVDSIGCTGCRYCVDGCPMNIPIPGIFSAMNERLIFDNAPSAHRRYGMVTGERGKAADCIACGQCEGACPQQLPVIELLKKCSVEFDQ
ncbi:MAG: aldo/keto reductase [Clostridia bacterium]|nr:aldo/keto reductase [Clostridia bacterium]